MTESNVIQKVAGAESALNTLLNDYNKLLTKYTQTQSFAQKIKQAVVIKKYDVTITNILEHTTKTIAYATVKNILTKNLAKHYNNLIQQKLTTYKNARESVFSTRKSKMLKKRRATRQKKKASLHSVPVPSSATASAASPEAVL